jgi:NAD(P)-dependent dehydrogenase (short-subunit alcohol dehydrogenase family)
MFDAQLTLVTGASSGIGREIAIHLSESRSVLIHGRDLDRLEETLSLCSPGNHQLWSFDLERVTDIREALTTICAERQFVVSDFVHCAGIPAVSAARMMSAAQIQKVFNINTISALEICATLLRKNNQGALKNIVFVTSIWGLFGSVGHAVYSATKGALDAAMKSLSIELAPATRVNSLALGAIETPMAASALSNPEIRAHMEKNYPLGIGTTKDAAAICEFILSDAAKWLTGQVIVADGGRTAHMSNK